MENMTQLSLKKLLIVKINYFKRKNKEKKKEI